MQISIIDNGDSYQWQLSTNGTTWADVSNTATVFKCYNKHLDYYKRYQWMNGFKYRVQLNKIGNSCGLNSNETINSLSFTSC
jgi:hypothetical protein